MRPTFTTLIEAVAQLDPAKPVALDTETSGFYGKIELLQLHQAGVEDVFCIQQPDPSEIVFSLANHHLVMHNASYDVSTIQIQSGIRWVPKKLDDTFYLSRLKYYKKQKFSLDAVAKYVLGYDPYERAGLDKTVEQKSDWSGHLTKEQKTYAMLDGFCTAEIFEDCKDQVDKFSYKLDMLALQYALDFQCNGFPVLEDERIRLEAKNNAAIAKLAVPINVNSYQQVRPYIGSDQSNALGLAKLTIEGNKRAADVNATRKLIKMNSFLKKFLTDDGRIYGKFAPSARSGRFTCKDQNLEQLPRATKGCFGTTTESGRCLVYSDYPGLELRCACVITNDSVMERLMRNGEDLHDYVATVLFGEGFTPTQRQITKTCNFNLLYGGGWKMLQGILIERAGLLIEEVELKGIIKKWKQLFSGIAAWQRTGIEMWRHNMPKATPLGRRYTGKLMTDHLNIEVSGFGAEVAKLAMHYMMPHIKEVEGADMVNFIHDSYLVECNIEDAPVVARRMGEAMQEAWQQATQNVKISDLPMPIQVTWGYNWKGIESGDHIGELKL